MWIISVLVLISAPNIKGLNLTKNEETLIMDFANSLNIPHCIMVIENVEELASKKYIDYFSFFSLKDKYLVFKTEEQLQEYVLQENIVNVKTLIILKMANRENQAQFLRQIKRVSTKGCYHCRNEANCTNFRI